MTHLSLLAGSALDAAGELSEAGVPVAVWDEAYGTQAGGTDPCGGGIWINEQQTDLHRYQVHQGRPDPRLTVVAVRYSPDFAADLDFFGALGFHPEPGGDEHW